MPPSRLQNGTARLATATPRPLLVHSHLRWDFVWQRPQQLMSRFAQRAPVFFLEEPIFTDDIARPVLRLSLPMPNVHRAIPYLPGALRDEGDAAIAAVRELAQRALDPATPLGASFVAPVQWFYTPMPAPAMLGAFGEVGVVYDCMDELSQFRFAPPTLRIREQRLLASADVVFAGGRGMADSKSAHHRNVHFFGCGVDEAHFARARDAATPIPDDVASLPRPILGYFGVVDERLDYELIRRLAEADPSRSVVMVGPVVKVDPADLPKRPNIHWLGQRGYDQLPSYVKAFDVCLMPFALNEATEYINPTKTLEYMAAGKPIVSTSIREVRLNFTPVVTVAESHDEFVAQVDAAARGAEAELVAQGIERARHETWDAIVAGMTRHIADAVTHRERTQAHVAAKTRVRRQTGSIGAEGGEELRA